MKMKCCFLFRKLEKFRNQEQRPPSIFTMAEPLDKCRRVEPSTQIPTLTVYTLAGHVVWGPEKIVAGMTVADLASKLDRPSSSPGLKLVHKEQILHTDVSLEGLLEPWELVVHFDPPKPYDHSFVKDFVELSNKNTDTLYMSHEWTHVPELAPQELQVLGAEVTHALIQSCEKGCSGIRFCVQLRLPASSPMILQRSTEDVTLKLESATFHGKGRLSLPEGIERLTAELVGQNSQMILAKLEFGMELDDEEWDDLSMSADEVKLLMSPLDRLIQRHASKVVREGVSFETNAVSEDLTKRLSSLIDQLKAAIAADYHPGTQDVVRDIVHPSLFPYVEGMSKTTDMTDVAPKEAGDEAMWTMGRPYESSKYQWLPAEVVVSASGKCSFETYINNLSRQEQPALYEALEELLSNALPHLETAWSHGSSVEPPEEDDDMLAGWMEHSEFEAWDPEAEHKSLRGKTIQVIVKIVDYELPPQGVHEGVWHVEGMSHENIVATAELILQKDAALKGGDLEFQRSFTSGEGGNMTMGLPQCRPSALDEVVDKGLVPLGHLPLPCGRLASWPNSHIHRVTRLENTAQEAATRRIIVFWLVNPEKRIVSTKHVPPQQGTMPLEEAFKHRLALMEERKYHKQAWNLREVTLCEH